MSKRKRYRRKEQTFETILNRLAGVNGKFTYLTKRKKIDSGEIVKRIYVFMEIPITRNHDTIKEIINKNDLDIKPLSFGKIVLEPTDIQGIEILKGILVIKPKDHKKIHRLLNQMMDILMLSNNQGQ